jgi:hypothetical protein
LQSELLYSIQWREIPYAYAREKRARYVILTGQLILGKTILASR